MKRILLIIAVIVGALVIMVAIAIAYINSTSVPSFENNAPDIEIAITDERVVEGARIASMMCANCHRSEDRRLGGAQMFEASDFGEIWSSNITNHPQYGIADYTDGELAYLLRTGIKKDGQYSPPYMPKFPLW